MKANCLAAEDHQVAGELASTRLLLDERHGGTALLLAKRSFAPNGRPTSHQYGVGDPGQLAEDLHGRGTAANNDDSLPMEFLGPVEINGMELTPGERVGAGIERDEGLLDRLVDGSIAGRLGVA